MGGMGRGGLQRAGLVLATALLGRRCCASNWWVDNTSNEPDSTSALPDAASGPAYGIDFRYAGHTYAQSWQDWMYNPWVSVGMAVEAGADVDSGYSGRDLAEGVIMYAWWLNHREALFHQKKNKRIPFDVLTVSVDSSNRQGDQHVANIMNSLGVKIILGPMDDTLFHWGASTFAASKLIIISAGTAHRGSLQNIQTFSFKPPPEYVWENAFDTLKEAGARSVAVFMEDTPYQRQACSQAESIISERDLLLLQETRLPADANESSILQHLQAAADRKVDVLLGCLSPNLCIRLMQQSYLLDYNMPAYVLGECALHGNVMSALGDKALYVLAATPFMPDFSLDVLEEDDLWVPSELNAIWKASHTSEVPHNTVMGFLAGYIFARTFSIAGSGEVPKVVEALQSINISSPFGRIAFNSDGYRDGSREDGGGTGMLVQLVSKDGGGVTRKYVHSVSDLTYPRPAWSMMPCLSKPTMLTYITGHGVNMSTGVCEECPSGKLMMWDARLGHNVCNYCQPGREPFQIPGGREGFFFKGPPQFVCTDCPIGWYSGIGARCRMCPLGTYSDTAVQTACHLCPKGTFSATMGATTCSHCEETDPNSTYTWYSTSEGSSECRQCKPGGYCPADENGLHTSMTNLGGYYLMGEGDNVQVYRCRHGEEGDACVMGNRCYTDPETGEESMTGPFCGICKPGYGRSSPEGYCTKCASPFVSIMYSMGVLILLIGMAAGMAMLVILTDFSKPKNHVVIILKIAWSYVQISSSVLPFITFWEFSIFYALGQTWRISLTGWIRVLMPAFSLQGAFCASRAYFPHVQDWKVSTIMGLLLIPLWTFALVFLFGLNSLWRHLRGHELPKRDTFVSILVANFFIVQPRANEALLDIFRCKHFDTMRMLQDTSVECHSDEHWQWMIINSVGLLIYSLGIPLGLFCMLFYYKTNDHLKDDRILRSLGFMYAGFEPSCYYWECLLMFRRILFPIAATVPQTLGINGGHMANSQDLPFRQSESLFELGAVTLLLALNVMFLALHLLLQPFDNRSYFILDRIEESAQWACLSMSLSQAISVSASNGQVIASVCCVIVLMVNMRFLILLCWGLGLRKVFQRYFGEKGFSWAQPPMVKITEMGLEFSNVKDNSIAKKSLANIFEDIVEHFIDTSGSLSYRNLVSSLQRLGLICLQLRMQDEENARGNFLSLVKRVLQRFIDTGILSEKFCQTALKSLSKKEEKLMDWASRTQARRRRRKDTSTVTQTSTGARSTGLSRATSSLSEASSLGRDGLPGDDSGQEDTGYGGRESGRCKSRLEKAFGQSYTVEDFHRALLICLKRANTTDVFMHDFGDKAITRAMGTPHHEEGGHRHRSRALRQKEMHNSMLHRRSSVPGLQSVFKDSAELRAERRHLMDEATELEQDLPRLQAKLERAMERAGYDTVPEIDEDELLSSSSEDSTQARPKAEPKRLAKLSRSGSMESMNSRTGEAIFHAHDALHAAKYAEEARQGADVAAKRLKAMKKRKKKGRSTLRSIFGGGSKSSAGGGGRYTSRRELQVRIDIDNDGSVPPTPQAPTPLGADTFPATPSDAEGRTPMAGEALLPIEEVDALPADLPASPSRSAPSESSRGGETATSEQSSPSHRNRSHSAFLAGLESEFNDYCQTFFDGAVGSLLPARPGRQVAGNAIP